MITRDNQIIILRELKKLRANIQPIDYWQFQSDFALKHIGFEDLKPCMELLESRKLVKVEPLPIPEKGAAKLGFLIWIESLGIEEIDKYDDEIKQRELDELKETKSFNRTLKSTLLGAAAGGLIGLIPQLWQKDTILTPVVLPTIQIVHDTVYIKTESNNLKRIQDTSLVRLVKLKHKK